MPTPRLKVQHRSDPEPRLEEILSCVKSLHVTLSAVMVDVAAIRRTTFDNSDDTEICRGHLKQAIETAKPLVAGQKSSQSFLNLICTSDQLSLSVHS